jgi:hypothetical protein
MAGAKSAKKQKKEEKKLETDQADSDSDDAELMPPELDAVDEEEEEETVLAGESDAAKERRLKASRRNGRKNARQRCYRGWAKKAGAGDVDTPGEFGNDLLSSTLSISDVNRMATWAPECVEIGSNLEEFKLMLGQREERLGQSAAHVLRVNVEGVARKIVLELTERCLESNGPQTISAAHVRSLLRPYEKAMEVTSIAPDGLIRFAQMKKKTRVVTTMTPEGKVNKVEETDETVLPLHEEDNEAIAAERKFAKANHLKLLKEADKERDERRAEKKKTRDAAKQTAAAVA